MSLPSFEEFAAEARGLGYPDVLAREWPADEWVPEHQHPFAVHALVVQGSLALTMRGETLMLRPGDRFELAHDEPHTERYGESGATYWVGRR